MLTEVFNRKSGLTFVNRGFPVLFKIVGSKFGPFLLVPVCQWAIFAVFQRQGVDKKLHAPSTDPVFYEAFGASKTLPHAELCLSRVP